MLKCMNGVEGLKYFFVGAVIIEILNAGMYK